MSLFKNILLLAVLFASVSCKGEQPEKRYEPVEIKAAKGSVVRDLLVDTDLLSGAKGVFSIYLPENYASSGKTYPVLYLLHGMYGDNNDWIYNDMQTVTNNYVGMGLCPELIVVMPDGNNDFYVDGYTRGINYESYLHQVLIPYIESTYPCRTDRESRAIAGLSMGGFGTVYHAFKYPDKFCLAYSMSGAVSGIGSPATPSLQSIFEKNYTAEDFDHLPELVLECGKEDPLCYQANAETHAFLQSIGFEHQYIIRSGVHDWTFWNGCYPKVLAKLKTHFTKTE